MKKITLLFAGVLLAALCSCSSSNEPKEISPTSTEFQSGGLSKLIEVVDEPCQLTYAEKDGSIATQFIRLKVKLKLKKESPELKGIDAQDIDFTDLIAVATVNLIDEAETTIQDLSVKLEDMLKLKKLLKGKEGDTETVTFEGEFHNSDDAPKWFESAAGFTPNLTGEVSTGGENADSGSDEGEYALTGFVDKYPVTMSLNIGVTNVNGTYYYDSKGPTKKLKLVGTNDDGVLDLNETDANGTPTGHFKGKFKGGVFKGVFVTNQGKKMPFELSEDGSVSSVDLSFDEDFDDDDDDEMDYSSNSSSDEIDDTDVDRYIDEYEKFWRDYVSFIKKMDKNDPTAMIEYSKMMSKIQSLDEKGKKLKGKMSTRQLERLNKMHMELMELMQKLN